jgi:hypothetical protein
MKSKAGAALFAVVFALGFGAVGAFALHTLAGQLSGWWQARSWQPVSATVVSAELKTSSGESTSYKALARYRYVVDGQTHEGNRIDLGGASNNAWHQEQYARLKHALSAQRPIEVWIDPADPTHSVVDRDLRLRDLVLMVPFATLFPMVSIGALWVLVRLFRTPADDASWQAKKAAANGREIKSDARTSARVTWFFAIFWNLISFPLAFAVVPGHGSFGAWLLVLLFPLVGLLLIWMAAAQTLRLRRTGEITIHLSPTQPRLGQAFTVNATFTRTPPAGEHVFTLICEEVDTRPEDTRYRTKWKQERAVQLAGTYAAVTFSPPPHLPPSERDAPVFHRWRVLLAMPGGKDERAFDVTLFAGREDSAPAPGAEEPIDAAIDEATDEEIGDVIARPVPPSIATILDERSGLKITYAADAARSAVPFGLFALIALGTGAFLIFGTGPGLMPKVMGVMFAAVGGAILIASLYVWTHRRTVEISNGRLVVKNHWLLRSSRRECSVGDVRTVTTRIRGGSTAGSRRYDHHEIKALLSNGGDISLASDIRDAGIALTLEQLLRKHVGLVPGEELLAAHADSGAGHSMPDQAISAGRASAARVTKLIQAGVTVLAALLTLAFLWDTFGGTLFDRKPARSADSKAASLQLERTDPLSNADRALFRAVEPNGTVEAVASALANGARVDAHNELGTTPLFVAAKESSPEVIDALIRAGANINFRVQIGNDLRGRTPLMNAATGTKGETVALLLDAGADANVFESHGWSAAHFAAHRDNVEGLRALHRHGVDLDLRNPGNRGETPLMIAACYGQLNAIRVLIELGANPRATDRQGESVYGWAKYFKRTEAMEALKEYQ